MASSENQKWTELHYHHGPYVQKLFVDLVGALLQAQPEEFIGFIIEWLKLQIPTNLKVKFNNDANLIHPQQAAQLPEMTNANHQMVNNGVGNDAINNAVQKNIPTEIQCGFCEKAYKKKGSRRPVVLPACGCTVCACCSTLIQHCPFCRTTIRVPADKLVCNFDLADLLGKGVQNIHTLPVIPLPKFEKLQSHVRSEILIWGELAKSTKAIRTAKMAVQANVKGKERKYRSWLAVEQLLGDLAVALWLAKPEDPLGFMLEWFSAQAPNNLKVDTTYHNNFKDQPTVSNPLGENTEAGVPQVFAIVINCACCSEAYTKKGPKRPLVLACGHTLCATCHVKKYRLDQNCPRCFVPLSLLSDEPPCNVAISALLDERIWEVDPRNLTPIGKLEERRSRLYNEVLARAQRMTTAEMKVIKQMQTEIKVCESNLEAHREDIELPWLELVRSGYSDRGAVPPVKPNSTLQELGRRWICEWFARGGAMETAAVDEIAGALLSIVSPKDVSWDDVRRWRALHRKVAEEATLNQKLVDLKDSCTAKERFLCLEYNRLHVQKLELNELALEVRSLSL